MDRLLLLSVSLQGGKGPFYKVANLHHEGSALTSPSLPKIIILVVKVSIYEF